MYDIHSDTRVVTALAAAVLSADPTPIVVDLADYQAAELVLAIGVGGITFTGTNRIDYRLSHGDTPVAAEHAAVTTDDMLGVTVASGGIIKSLTSAHASANTYRYGYKGGKRYVSFLPDFSGTHGTGTPMSAAFVLARGMVNPQANQA